MTTRALLVAVVLGCGCARTTSWVPPETDACASIGPCPRAQNRCRATLCLPGASTPGVDSNELLRDRCDAIPGIVKRCTGAECTAVMKDIDDARDAIEDFDALTGLLDAELREGGCSVDLIGHSWGGVDVVTLASEIEDTSSLRVHLTAVIDGFAFPHGDFIEVAEISGTTVSFLHTDVPDDDCSRFSPLGPYVGLPIRCAKGADCIEFNLSEVVESTVDHCEMVNASFPFILQMIDDVRPTLLDTAALRSVQRR